MRSYDLPRYPPRGFRRLSVGLVTTYRCLPSLTKPTMTFDPTSKFQGITLQCGTLTYVATEDYARVVDHEWHMLGGYAVKYGPFQLLHYLVLNLEEKVRGFEVHHKDNFTLNNCYWNLEHIPTSLHKRKHGLRSTNRSGFKGVHWRAHEKGFSSQITINYKVIRLGVFPTAEEAALAYDKKAVEVFGTNIYLNFPSACCPK